MKIQNLAYDLLLGAFEERNFFIFSNAFIVPINHCWNAFATQITSVSKLLKISTNGFENFLTKCTFSKYLEEIQT